jgi:hypothetical protein
MQLKFDPIKKIYKREVKNLNETEATKLHSPIYERQEV